MFILLLLKVTRLIGYSATAVATRGSTCTASASTAQNSPRRTTTSAAIVKIPSKRYGKVYEIRAVPSLCMITKKKLSTIYLPPLPPTHTRTNIIYFRFLFSTQSLSVYEIHCCMRPLIQFWLAFLSKRNALEKKNTA